MISSLESIKNPFFVGVAGAGMSAIAQYLQGTGLQVGGSDRFFNDGKAGDIKAKLEAEGIYCFFQNGDGITSNTDVVVVSTAIEDTVIEGKGTRYSHYPAFRVAGADRGYKKDDSRRRNKWQKYHYRDVV
jgi:UDP-N-acetylmuramate--alanine ligase